MKILALETSGENCSACIIDDEKVIADFNVSTGTTHSQILLPMIDQMKQFTGIELEDIDLFACSVGPGSFTGLRIGIATIKGFAIGLDKKVIGIPTLVGLAYNISNFDGIICSIIDARNDNVYAGLFRSENGEKVLIEDYFTDQVDLLIENLKNKNENIIFVGDGATVYREKIISALNEKAYFAPIHLNNQLSTSIAKAAMYKASNNEFDTYDSIMPMYLKKSQAEREYEQKNGV